jgi:hypothetical protein
MMTALISTALHHHIMQIQLSPHRTCIRFNLIARAAAQFAVA